MSADPPNYQALKKYTKQALEDELKKHQLLCTWCFRIYMTFRQLPQLPQLPQSSFNPAWPCAGRLCNLANLYYKHYQLCAKCKAYHAELQRELAEHVNAYKRSFKHCEACCVQIKPGNEMCFDLDHLDPYKKEHNISHLVRRLAPIATIDKELRKCRLLCCHCHIDHTKTQTGIFQRQDFKRLRNHLKTHGQLEGCNLDQVSESSQDDSDLEPEPVIRSTYNPLDDKEAFKFKPPPPPPTFTSLVEASSAP